MQTFHTESMQKPSLQTRLSRLKAGFPTSPQYSAYLMQEFCSQKILPCLNDKGTYYLRRRLLEIAQQHLPHADASGITFGDLAVLISQNYRSAAPKKPLDFQKVLSVYFCDIDFLVAECHCSQLKASKLRDPNLKLQFQFLNIPYGDFRSILGSLPMPSFSRNYQKRMQETNCFFDDMHLYDVYQTVRDITSRKLHCRQAGQEIPDFDDADENAGIWTPALQLQDCLGLIEFFVIPVAGMFWKQKEDRSSNKPYYNTSGKDDQNESEYHE